MQMLSKEEGWSSPESRGHTQHTWCCSAWGHQGCCWCLEIKGDARNNNNVANVTVGPKVCQLCSKLTWSLNQPWHGSALSRH